MMNSTGEAARPMAAIVVLADGAGELAAVSAAQQTVAGPTISIADAALESAKPAGRGAAVTAQGLVLGKDTSVGREGMLTTGRQSKSEIWPD